MDRATEWGPLFIDPSPVRTQEAPDENSRRHEYVCASASTFFGGSEKKREREIKRKIGQHLLGNGAPSMDNKSAATLLAPGKSSGRGKFDCARSA